MQTNDFNTISSQLRYIVSIKLGRVDFYPKSLAEWLDVYFYTNDGVIKWAAMQEMEKCSPLDNCDILERLYLTSDDAAIKKLAFKLLPSRKGFNKEYIACRNSISCLSTRADAIIPRTSVEHNIRMLKKMLDNSETLDELLFILSSASELEKRVDIFRDSDLRLQIDQIYDATVTTILKLIVSSELDLSHNFVSKENDDKLGLLDLNQICLQLGRKDWRDCEKIISIIESNLSGDFNYYISLYQIDGLHDDISKIIFSKIESSKPTAEELVKLFEDTRNSNSEKLRNYCLDEIVKIFVND